ncbi:MAG: hypothetical protein QMD32_08660 [Smithellaceae bacterium]|nr:hypothetical protein [Smithellaceae bacterium]
MLPAKIIMDNRKTFLAYNEFRKDIFSRLAPRESEVILYLLPWLLSINHPAFPGYVKNLAHPVQVKNINNEKK